jgi:hypothetical protein
MRAPFTGYCVLSFLVACGASTGGKEPGEPCVDDSECAGGSCGGGGTCIDPGGPEETFDQCRYIDVVIAVDNSSSMSEEKDALRDIAFPGFANALIQVAGGIEDFRVGVLDACPAPASFLTRGVSGQCNFQSSKPWMESTSTALVDEFKCVGDVFSGDSQCSGDNDDEQPATSASAALETALPGTGMPNDGFMRDEALLVIVAITDEDEQPTPDASAQEVYDRLVALKGGDVSRIVFLGIGGASSCDGAYGSAKHASKLQEVTQLFVDQGRGLFYDLCQGNLEQGLTQALTTIDSACRAFPGPLL